MHTCSEKYDCLDLYFLEKGQSPDYYRAVIEDYLDSVLSISRWGRFNVLGHLSLPLRYMKEHLDLDWSFAPWMDRVEEIFSVIIPQGIGIECNTNRGNQPLPDADILRLYRQMGGEVITLGSDAHETKDVGCVIRERQQLLRDCGFRYFTTFTGGRPEFRKL